ncbi:hypothetical protein [Collimonas pratensis]|uniref:hypothetical protein n=1 Tax=Collimonas pratensis TaxID=279113 RepID=UPI000785D26D|nr:hypothetical protein [Collimonas pratensis]
MNKAFRDTAGGIAIAIALLAAGYFLGTFHTHPLTKAADFPAWVQAIGSIVAIFAAIGISYTQQRNAIKRESRKVIDENLYTVKSIRDELAVLSEGFELHVGKEIRSLKRGDILLIEWNPAERPFVVYEACASQLGKIDDDRLRKNIIYAFAQARGLVLSIRTNTRLIERLDAAQASPIVPGDERRQQSIDVCEDGLKSYAMRIKLAYARAKATEIEFNAAVGSYLERNAVE